MKYVIEVLEKEKRILIDCLSAWELESHPEARKERERRLNELAKAIKLLSNSND